MDKDIYTYFNVYIYVYIIYTYTFVYSTQSFIHSINRTDILLQLPPLLMPLGLGIGVAVIEPCPQPCLGLQLALELTHQLLHIPTTRHTDKGRRRLRVRMRNGLTALSHDQGNEQETEEDHIICYYNVASI